MVILLSAFAVLGVCAFVFVSGTSTVLAGWSSLSLGSVSLDGPLTSLTDHVPPSSLLHLHTIGSSLRPQRTSQGVHALLPSYEPSRAKVLVQPQRP